ncbi:MAG: prepilin-type N-terminal cleavage/methylation domain-containing protein [Phycisphaerae bacterium]|jgi:prepilin-type N-terminal cleavage/methylation domain-containing protein/prepilin-type processing-associated H-X9-DG protein
MHRSAFTVIELLVVIAIIALLLAILLPSLKKARIHAKEVVCGSTLNGFGKMLGLYTYANNDWLPGVNTSGVSVSVKKSADLPEALYDPFLPVQPFDWLTPLLIQEITSLPEKRADRFNHLLDYYRCPALTDTASLPYGSPPDDEDFEAITHWPATSYLMPAYFQYWGDQQAGQVLASMERINVLKVRAQSAPDIMDKVRVKDYVSRMNRVGGPENKIFVADGTRYLTEEYDLDFDIEPFPTFFGSFTSSGAWWRGSTAYGVSSDSEGWSPDTRSSKASPSEGQNLTLSYRHGLPYSHRGRAEKNLGMINALFFDGHVELLSDRDSREIGYWYPRGAVVVDPDEGMTEVPEGFRVN